MNNTSVLQTQNTTLLDVLDRVLDKGVAVYGDVVLSVADIDLVYLNLRLLLSSIGTLERLSKKPENAELKSLEKIADNLLLGLSRDSSASQRNLDSRMRGNDETNSFAESLMNSESSSIPNLAKATPGVAHSAKGLSRAKPSKAPSRAEQVNFQPEKVEKGLAKLVLIIVELLRKLMEKQALRRLDDGQLDPNQTERMGLAFKRLQEKVEELKKVFGLENEELNLNLGPVGRLM